MASTDLTTVTYGGNYGLDFNVGEGRVGCRSRTIDTAVTGLASGTNYKLMFVAAGTYLRVNIAIETAEGAADTADFGITEGGTEIKSNADMNSAAGTIIAGTELYIATDTYIYIKPDAALGTVKFTVFAECIKKTA